MCPQTVAVSADDFAFGNLCEKPLNAPGRDTAANRERLLTDMVKVHNDRREDLTAIGTRNILLSLYHS